ncbi:MAG: recombinase zinc beta ribbon domain-containing protein [Elusimicrobia bacterium]|nr:recombinase zinc beta ribbon domain-containing protein [Elusimicrobiota bacterium]
MPTNTSTGRQRYFYYRCTSTNHRGWNACGTRQISADRLDDIILGICCAFQWTRSLSKPHAALKNQLHNPPQRGSNRPPLGRLDPRNRPKSLHRHM